ncbi:DUF1997 domain-containing protein [Oscillatoriales cyanobacterium LEGE 11467]|uniref:DUF1997 domain-containing protein n=1 Tax=Zarconia navalis LEGE 11467 TaxID=1828826 RepID=A0A928VVL5_9CYAN|nr:DUF1997 domain-containing protein [Zarconia navalis]MBE9039542.1 DUF1997 domain-containing protein [Zarconia navalis LEGE 11467]
MYTRFFASLPAEIAVPEQPVPIQHYLRQPQRLVNALVDPTRLERLGGDRFRIHVRPLNFMMLKIQPTVDLKIWTEASGAVHLHSSQCELRGIDNLKKRFTFNLAGTLVPHQGSDMTYLRGRANLEVRVELPPALWLTPKSILEGAGNALLMSVLRTIEQRLMRQLLVDYKVWANDVGEQVSGVCPAGRLSAEA